MNPDIRNTIEQDQALFAAGVRHGRSLGYWSGYWAGREALVQEQLEARPKLSDLRENLTRAEDHHAREHMSAWRRTVGARELRRSLAELEDQGVKA